MRELEDELESVKTEVGKRDKALVELAQLYDLNMEGALLDVL